MKQFKHLMESLPAKTVVFAFGRFNPPTTGHELLVKFVKKLAKSNSADYVIYASATQDKKKNPLSVDKKIHYLNLMFPSTNFMAAGGTERTFIEVAKHLNKKYRNIIMVAGSDRVEEYERLLTKQNGIDFHFDSVKVMSAGERDADSDDASGMSASKMRAAASKGEYATFKKGLPSSLRDIDGKRLMNDVRAGLGLEHIKEHIVSSSSQLREMYIAGEIFKLGELVESAGQQFEIIDRGSNYLTVVDSEGATFRKWLHECKVVGIAEDVQPGYAPAEISFKGYTTKNLHHSGDAAKAFQETIERYGKNEPATVLAALKATDTYMKLNDMHLEQGKAPDTTELASWREAHQKARDSLNRIGEFMHHQDYWHMHEHEIQDMEANYTPETAGAEMADSYQPQGNLVEASAAARFNQKVKQAQDAHEAGDHKRAKYHLDTARNFMLGINSNDHGKIKDSYPKYKELRNLHKEEVELDEDFTKMDTPTLKKWINTRQRNAMGGNLSKQRRDQHDQAQAELKKRKVNEELTDKTIKSGDKIKVARVIADMLGVENAETISPDAAVNAGLRKIKTKRMTPEMIGVVKKMLGLAQEVGIKVDMTLVPKAVSEATELEEDTVNKKSTYNAAKDILRYNDFQKLKKLNNEQAPADDEDDVKGPNSQDNAPSAVKVATGLEGQDAPHTAPGSTLGGADDQHRRRKVAYKLGEDMQSADYKVSASGHKYRARHIDFQNSTSNGNPVTGDEDGDSGAKDIKHKKNKPLLKKISEQVDEEPMSEKELDDIANGVSEVDHVLDAYDDAELSIIDSDTGEELSSMNEEVEQLNEVLSRIERMKAKIRFARTESKRERKVQIALRTRSSSAKINQRARKLAVSLMKERLIKKPVAKMTIQEKERAEAMIAKRKAAIGRLAMKLAPRVRKIETDRLSHSKVTK